MTRDDVIRMAQEAGFETGTALCEVVVRHSNGSWVGINAELIEFAALVAAAERDRMCEQFNIPKELAHEKAKSNETNRAKVLGES